MTTEELVNLYVNYLIVQFKMLPKARATVAAVCTTIIADQIAAQVRDGFDIETAIGNQLDILGHYVGAQRLLPDFSATVEYMAFPAYADTYATTCIGFSLYSDTVAPVGDWRLYSTTDITLTLSDGQLRSLIQYLITLHASDYSNKSLDDIFELFFGGYATITDNGDMSVTYTHDATNDPFILFQIVDFIGALPRPAGVKVIVVET